MSHALSKYFSFSGDLMFSYIFNHIKHQKVFFCVIQALSVETVMWSEYISMGAQQNGVIHDDRKFKR